MFAKKSKVARAQCDHDKTITIRTAGIERSVCEQCGNVSISAPEGLSGTASRSQFERVSERTVSTLG
ncbi:MAG TPA: hypothetical protein VI141_08375 [Acidimicrobiia bacterium]